MPNQASKIYSTWLTVKLSLICFYYPLKAIILSYFKKNTRTNCDRLIKSFATRSLKPLKISFVRHQWQILEQLPKDKPVILMSNHTSLYDIPILQYNMPNNISFRMLAKKELSRIPIFGKGMKALGFPMVDRKDRKQAIKDLEYTKQLMLDGTVIWAAPEGTRSPNGELLKFKKGIFIMAIELQALIVPISIKGAHKVLPAKSRNYSLGETVELFVGTPIDTAGCTLNDRDTIMDKIRNQILLYL